VSTEPETLGPADVAAPSIPKTRKPRHDKMLDRVYDVLKASGAPAALTLAAVAAACQEGGH
jgi:hypothetical protein